MKGIPFLVFDAGGVLEMFDPKEFEDNVVFEPTLAALKRKLSQVRVGSRHQVDYMARHQAISSAPASAVLEVSGRQK